MGLRGDGAEGVAIEVFLDSSQGLVDHGRRLLAAFIKDGLGNGAGGPFKLAERGFVAENDLDDGLFTVVGGDPGEATDDIESAGAVGFDLQGNEGGPLGVGVSPFAD